MASEISKENRLNILTKISIVVLVVLVLFASAVFITQATVTPNYRDKANAEKLRADMAQMEAQQKEVLLKRMTIDRDSVAAQVGAVQTKLDESRTGAIAQQQKDAEALLACERQAVVHVAEKAQLAAMLAVEQKESARQAADLATYVKEANDARAEKTQLAADLLKAGAERDRLSKQVAFWTAQVDMYKQQLEGRPVAGSTNGSTTPTPAAPTRFTGTVTAVAKDLAEVNIGSNNGVQKGDKLKIYRGEQFVGYLQVERVEANTAAGVIVDNTSPVEQNDKVTNILE